MNVLKQVRNTIRALYNKARHRTALTILHIIHRLAFKRIKRVMVKQNSPLHQAADELKPILDQVSQTINDKPELVQATLQHILNKVQHLATDKNNEPEETASLIESTSLEQTLQHLFAELNLSQPANVVLDKRFELTHQFIDSVQLSQQPNPKDEAVNAAPMQWDDFISESNHLSLDADQIQVRVNQLLSSYEIN